MAICTCDPKVQDPSQLPGSLRRGTGASFPTLDRYKDRRPALGSCLRQRGLPRGTGQPSPHTPWQLRSPPGGAGTPHLTASHSTVQHPLLSHMRLGPQSPHLHPNTPGWSRAQICPETLCLSPQQGPGRGDSRQVKCYSPPPRSCAAASGPLVSLKQRPRISISKQFKILC